MKDLIKNLPQSPGIYKMLDQDGQVIYVGKAKNIKARVGQYFQKNYIHSSRTQKLIGLIKNIKAIQTDTELEALILESNLIKELRPKYNILMKDDKSYVYIKINHSEDFPRIHVVREHEIVKKGRDPHAKYFGPKLASSKVYETLRILKRLFPFRHCQLNVAWKNQGSGDRKIVSPDAHRVEVTNRVIDFPCLDYYIKRCPGPCIGAVSPDEYKKVIHQITDFLTGKSDELEKNLTAQMNEAASQKLFEKAARLRDKLMAVRGITEQQKVTDRERRDTDVINYSTENGHVYFNILMIRGGKLINQENFTLDALDLRSESVQSFDLGEILESFLTQYYTKAAEVPKEVLIPISLEEMSTLEQWLTGKRGDAVHIIAPQRGSKNQLLALSLKNAVSFGKQYRIKWLAEQRGETALARLGEVLGMQRKLLKRIEGFDISHLGGNETVGSMVVFENGRPNSAHYRHFKMRTVVGKPDDYRSMEEILMRRLKYLIHTEEGISMKAPAKKDLEQIKKIIEDENLSNLALNPKEFLAAKRGKTLIGFGRVIFLSPKVPCISGLWVAPDERGKTLGYELIKKLIVRFKLKRVYLDTQKKLEDYYATFGFIALREPPAILVENAQKQDEQLRAAGKKIPPTDDLIYMAFDAIKHKEDQSFKQKPDLLLIDGGKGQLSTALLVLKRLKLEIPVISLAKRLEEIYVPGEKAPILLEEGDEALKLLQRIRDESHRLAITFQRKLHRKNLIHE